MYVYKEWLQNQHLLIFNSIIAKWSGDRTGQYSKTGALINTILSVLEDLDGYVFERLDSANCLDSLYSRLFDQVTIISNENMRIAKNMQLFKICHISLVWVVS